MSSNSHLATVRAAVFDRVESWRQSPVPSMLIAVLVLLAIILRVINLNLFVIFPDSYLQLETTQNILDLNFPPFSPLYAPGGAVIMAPFLMLLPNTFAGMQAVV